jgi:hypothetical protein
VRRVIAANEAGVRVATNNALLAVSEAYFDLQLAAGTPAIAREAAGNAEVLAGITGTYAPSGAGLEADHRRSLAELRSRQRSIRLAVGQLEIASADLVRPLNLRNIRRGFRLPDATRPIEVLQPIQALAQARTDYRPRPASTT